MKRFALFLTVTLLPVILLGYLYPDRALKGPTLTEVFPSTPGADIVVFVRDGCPHCAAFEEYANRNKWEVEYHEVTQIDSQKLFSDLQTHAPLLNQGVPTIVINGTVTQGYEDDQTGDFLKNKLVACQSRPDGCLPFKDFLESSAQVDVESAGATCTEDCETDESKYIFDLWIFGEVNLLDLSLPALSVLLGFLDGFNPCAMWMLVTLLTLLIATRDMKKVIIVAGTFLLVSGIMYYLFIAAWLNVFLLIGYNIWVQKVIGIIAIGAGGFYLYEALGKDPNVCHVTNYKRRQKIIERMKKISQAAAWPAMLLGVSILAISVNMIELVCTAGLPAIFTQILAFNEVPDLMRYWYIFLYILLYMIDDTIIFIIALVTLQASGMTTKYRRFTLVFGGVLMYALGLLLIFAPEALTFQ
ncbi:hypothetical protein HYZ98_04840 [Candidatus Peregrinibacteria bacterium]|nr:hypothetical protein [Candidatus Peregrinibacteria bacterium]